MHAASSTENTEKTLRGCQTWPAGQADKNFQGRTKIFIIIADSEKFCPRITIFRGTIFFLTVATRSVNKSVRVELVAPYPICSFVKDG